MLAELCQQHRGQKVASSRKMLSLSSNWRNLHPEFDLSLLARGVECNVLAMIESRGDDDIRWTHLMQAFQSLKRTLFAGDLETSQRFSLELVWRDQPCLWNNDSLE